MAKVNLLTISSGYAAQEQLNANFNTIAEALDNTLSRDGTAPNQLEADLDLNGHVILNSGASDSPNRVVSYAELTDYVSAHSSGLVVQRQESFVATSAQTVFVLTDFLYEPGSGNIAVYVDGVRKFTPQDYTETSSSSITFLSGLTLGQEVEVVQNEFLATVNLPSHTHPWEQITGAPSFATRWPTYAEVTDKPTEFPPEAHTHPASDITSGRLADARRGVYVQASQPSSPTTGDVWFWS